MYCILLNSKLVFVIFILLGISNAYTQTELEKELRIKKLEEQVNTLIEEVGNLKEVIQTQQKVIEKNTNKINQPQPEPYEEIIKELEADATNYDNSRFYYLKIINSHLEVGGYVESIFSAKNDEDSEFIFSRFALRIRSSIADGLTFQSEIAIEDEEDLEVSYAHLTFSFDPTFNIKTGLILVPFNQYNLSYQPPSQELTSIPLVDDFIIPTVWAEPGISIFGQFSNVGSLAITYEALLSNGLGQGGFDFEKGNRDARQNFNIDNNGNKQLSGRLGLIPYLSILPLGISVGVSGVIGKFDDKGNDEYSGIGLDGNFRIGTFSLIGDYNYIEILGEYTKFNIERDDRILNAFPQTSPAMEGYYIQLNYIFFPESWRIGNWFSGAESQLAFSMRYEKIDLDTSATGLSELDDQSIYTIGINFRPVYKTVFKVEYNRIRAFILGVEDWQNRILLSFATYF